METKEVKEVDQDILKRRDIKKMYLDQRGNHCFFLCEHDIFYNNYRSQQVFTLPIKSADQQTN